MLLPKGSAAIVLLIALERSSTASKATPIQSTSARHLGGLGREIAIVKIFESKRFGALLTGTIAFATFFLMNMTSWKALALAAIVMGLYFLIFRGPSDGN